MALVFCEDCGSIMVKSIVETGGISYKCRCGNEQAGAPRDTLMYIEKPNSATDEQHDILIDNSTHDLARNIVLKDCPKCGIGFLTVVRFGQNLKTIYVCECGYRISHVDYNKMIKDKKK